MLADLHTHTNASDSNLSRSQLLEIARTTGLDYIAITDHDTMKNSYAAADEGIGVIPGCELSAVDPDTGRMVHLLCYLPKRSLPLEEHFAAMHVERVRIGKEMAARANRIYSVVNEKNLAKYTAFSNEIHRQDIMNVLREFGYTTEMFGGLYNELFNRKDGRCFVATQYRTTEEVLDIARASRGVVVLAHPSVYDSMDVVRRYAGSGLLDGLEADHPRNAPADKEELAALCEEHGLVMTGGSDYHAANSHGSILPGAGLTNRKNLELLYEVSAQK